LRESSSRGVVFYGGDILLLQKHGGDWVLPKGHIEAGESASEAALREVLEETGISPSVVGTLKPTRYSFYAAGYERTKTVSWFLMEAADASGLRPERYFRCAEFVHPAEALRRLTFAADRELVQAALDLRRSDGPSSLGREHG